MTLTGVASVRPRSGGIALAIEPETDFAPMNVDSGASVVAEKREGSAADAAPAKITWPTIRHRVARTTMSRRTDNLLQPERRGRLKGVRAGVLKPRKLP